jgi:hypothetical protein
MRIIERVCEWQLDFNKNFIRDAQNQIKYRLSAKGGQLSPEIAERLKPIIQKQIVTIKCENAEILKMQKACTRTAKECISCITR